MSGITICALKFFYDKEIGDRRAPGDEWTTSIERAAQLFDQGLARGVEHVKRDQGPSADKRDRGPVADK